MKISKYSENFQRMKMEIRIFKGIGLSDDANEQVILQGNAQL